MAVHHPTLAGSANRSIMPVAVIFALILFAVWLPPGRPVLWIALATFIAIGVFSLQGGFSAQQLGLANLTAGLPEILTASAVLACMVAVAGLFTRSIGPAVVVPWHRAWQYAVWAMIQEFMLQSFFFVRLEAMLGGRKAVWAAAGLFALPHIPSPLLTVLSFCGALFFCEMFRRYRNIFPLGFAHAALGLTVAASFPDQILHHMRVGMGFLMYHV